MLAVIGGGAAGLMAAATAAQAGASVTLLEQNEKLGKKLYITGKGRCNLTNATDLAGLMAHTLRNPRFLYSAFHALDPVALMAYFESRGVPLKTERGNRVFPESDRAFDITDALAAHMREGKVRVELNRAVKGITVTDGGFAVAANKGTVQAKAVIIATGGLSYPSTGATGAGYALAHALGHTTTATFPSLVALNTAETWVADVAGLSLRNVQLTARVGKRIRYEAMGEMLFTPAGVSGPLVLSASAYLADQFDQSPTLAIDLKPALDTATLDARILRDFAAQPNKHFANALGALLPQRLVDVAVALGNIPADTPVHAVTRAQRQGLVQWLKHVPLTPTAAAGYREAVITRGGVAVKELNPSTLMSKHTAGLFFAGEVLDVDALTGGYNLHIAFSTGYLAGLSAAAYLQKD